MELRLFNEQLSRIADPAALLGAVFAHCPVPLAVLAEDGRLVLHNRALAELLGPDPVVALGPAHDGRSGWQELVEALPRVFQGETVRIPPRWLAVRPCGEDRERCAVEQKVFPVRSREARVVYAGSTFIDVTARLEREELQVKNARLEKQNARLSHASRHKSEFLASISHELRTPLNGIIGFAQLLHDGHVAPGAPEHEEFLGDILSSGRHLLRLLNDLLDLAKIEAGKIELRPEPADVRALVGEVCGSLRSMSARKRIEVEAAVSEGIADVTLDPGRFKQVLYNYVSNAIKFTPEGGRVAIRVTPEREGAVRLEVEDTGVGISPEDMTRLFLEFEQAGSELPRKQHGTGLGLALTRRIVEAQGGTVGVRSVLRKGSVFHAILPRRP